MFIFLGILCLGLIVLNLVMRKAKSAEAIRKVDSAIASGRYSENERDGLIERNSVWPIPGFVNGILGTAGAVFIVIGLWSSLFFMAEERYSYFVRDIAGQTYVYNTTGWHWKGFGTVVPIKNEMSVQFSDKAAKDADSINAGDGGPSNEVSVMMSPRNITFLDQVTADASSTVRFRMPNDTKSILKIIDSFGTPENLMRSMLIPSTERTIDATSALMTADKYFSGGKTEFMSEFDYQMRNGLYVVRVEERIEKPKLHRKGSANASAGTNQADYGDDRKITYIAVKQRDDSGAFKITKQDFSKYGITVTAAIITKLDPNPEFKNRMKQKQQASADLAIARENRKKEEEQTLLAVAKGKREVAESQAQELKKQIVETTKAETEKQLALTKANKELEATKIQEQTALIAYKRDKIKAKSVKVLADADAYKKRVVIQANGALEQKIEAYKYGVSRMAEALASYKAPQSVVIMGGSNSDGTTGPISGAPDAMTNYMQIIAANQAKQLSLDLSTKSGNIKGK